MDKAVSDLNLQVGDTVINTVGLQLFVKHIDRIKQIAYLFNIHNEMNPYKIERVLENIRSGKWSHQPAKKYANWI